ncbi:formylglycine-generating enzyme family protein [Tianweitania sediminis]|uniref:Formylglycine-generating enzyme family protein n=1 Tax=Tianweitania sediminis TaxID=1502156 RepID=A0A8J7R377_9HYPH|nr:formylglycine-generating enzyme family protein [Tianweitania sediminis]MBP0440083.1 formylglycine-generating enzyme family protein [Tianweitania sediminis]
MTNRDLPSCCVPSSGADEPTRSPEVRQSIQADVVHEECVLSGIFQMGDAFREGRKDDGEGPLHRVNISSFAIDLVCVTVQQFAAFVEDTGFVTTAERRGSSAVFHLAVAARSDDVLGDLGMPWWLDVCGADWRHPFGPLSDSEALLDHPVVHVSHDDARAYCFWAGRALPTEAEWEFAARGGLDGRRYAWGDELHPSGEHRANIWQGVFPTFNSGEDGFRATAPVKAFPPNGHGIYQTAGNVWEWCADWFDPGYYTVSPTQDPAGPADGAERVLRGGSYLCHASYCDRYRVSARSRNTPDATAGNIGFRTVRR